MGFVRTSREPMKCWRASGLGSSSRSSASVAPRVSRSTSLNCMHQGKMCCGRTPAETFTDGMTVWREKQLVANAA